jgi:hypothetical protein
MQVLVQENLASHLFHLLDFNRSIDHQIEKKSTKTNQINTNKIRFVTTVGFGKINPRSRSNPLFIQWIKKPYLNVTFAQNL